jgi:hypothetical protein
MATNDGNIEDLSDDELEARQRAEDGETPDHNPAGDDDAAATAAAAQAQADAAAAQAATDAQAAAAAQATVAADKAPADAAADKTAGADATAEPGKVDGVASKDGSRVLPYGALQAARRDARRAETRAERAERELADARQQLEDMKAGKAPESPITEADVADMEASYPDEGKKMRALFNRAQALEKQVPKADAPKDADAEDDPQLAAQEAIDQVPLLLDWQNGDPTKFARAVEHDAVLMKSPKWAGKPAVDRFTEAARRTADEYDIAFPETKPKPSTSTAAPAAPAQTAEQAAQRKPPETLSDFKGGSVADHGTADVQKLSPQALLGRMEGMTDDEIDAHLAKYG